MKIFHRNAGMIWTDVVSLAVILVFGVIAAVFCTAAGRNYDDTVVSLSEGWTSDDGSSYALNDLPLGDVTVSRSLEGIDLKGKSLCFKSADTHITVSFGGETAYTYAPEYPKLFGKSYGVYVHMVKIPEGAREVTLSLHPITTLPKSPRWQCR